MRASNGSLLLAAILIGCSSPSRSGEPTPMQGTNGAAANTVELLPSHVGKRVRAVFRSGTQIVTGTVLEVDRERDTATVRAEYGSTISFRPSQIAILEVFGGADEHAGHHERDAMPPGTRLSLAPARANADAKVLEDEKVQLLVVDWAAKKHDADACLVDLRKALEKAPSTVLWNDGASTAVLRVPVPADPEARLLPFAWHAHVVWGPVEGKKEERRDLFVGANSDGDVVLDLKELKDARQVLLMGVPYRVEDKLNGIHAIAPPRMIAIDLEDAAQARALLENNPTFVHRTETTTGRLYVASQSFNDSEAVFSAYDPEKASSAVMPNVRYSVQDALLYPAWTLDVTDPAGRHWQRLGGYPIPPSLSFEVPDATRVTFEVGMAKLGDFSSPPVPSVRVPETALVRADLDVHYAGVPEGHPHAMLLGYGLPTDPEKDRLFSPTATEVKAETRHELRKLDTTKLVASDDAYPCQAFVWYQMSTPWKKTGGFMAGATPMRAPDSKTAPARRVAHYPAISPGVKFITFNGPKSGGVGAAAGIPAALGRTALGGSTIGTGGPYVPFSPVISTGAVVDKKGTSATAPASASSNSAPFNIFMLNASSSAGSTAIAICNGGGGGGMCVEEEEKKKSDQTKPKSDRPNTATKDTHPGYSRPWVPTIDRFNPRPADLPYLSGKAGGWK